MVRSKRRKHRERESTSSMARKCDGRKGKEVPRSRKSHSGGGSGSDGNNRSERRGNQM